MSGIVYFLQFFFFYKVVFQVLAKKISWMSTSIPSHLLWSCEILHLGSSSCLPRLSCFWCFLTICVLLVVFHLLLNILCRAGIIIFYQFMFWNLFQQPTLLVPCKIHCVMNSESAFEENLVREQKIACKIKKIK